MKKIYILLLIILIPFLSFTNEKEELNWYSFEQLDKYRDQLKPFDIALLEKGKKITQIFGHIFLLDEDKKIIEIKGFDFSYSNSPMYVNFHIKNRKIVILRYKGMNDKLAQAIIELMPKYYNRKYNIFAPADRESDGIYCSQFIYSLFKEAGEKIGQDVRIIDPTWPILPYDFLKSDQFEKVKLIED